MRAHTILLTLSGLFDTLLSEFRTKLDARSKLHLNVNRKQYLFWQWERITTKIETFFTAAKLLLQTASLCCFVTTYLQEKRTNEVSKKVSQEGQRFLSLNLHKNVCYFHYNLLYFYKKFLNITKTHRKAYVRRTHCN